MPVTKNIYYVCTERVDINRRLEKYRKYGLNYRNFLESLTSKKSAQSRSFK